MTSAYGLRSGPIHSRRSRIKAPTGSDTSVSNVLLSDRPQGAKRIDQAGGRAAKKTKRGRSPERVQPRSARPRGAVSGGIPIALGSSFERRIAMTAAATDTLSLLAALIPLAWVLALVAIPLTAVFDAMNLRSQQRPGMTPIVEAVGEDRD